MTMGRDGQHHQHAQQQLIEEPDALFGPAKPEPLRTFSAADIHHMRQRDGHASLCTPYPHWYLRDVLPFAVDIETIRWIESLQPFGPFAYDPLAHDLIDIMLVADIRKDKSLWEAVQLLVADAIAEHERRHHAA